MKDDNSEGAFHPLKKVKGKVISLIDCSNPKCFNKFAKRGIKKYCSPQCQWTVYNALHPIQRKVQ